MERVNPAELLSSSAIPASVVSEPMPAPVILTQKERLDIAVEALANEGMEATFNTVRDIEHLAPEVFSAHPVAGTPFEPIANAYNAHGVATEMTLGATMQTMWPDLSAKERQDKAHGYICYCNVLADKISGCTVVQRLITDVNTLE